MIQPAHRLATTVGVLVASTLFGSVANAQTVKKVFVIAMENTNWTQPNPARQFSGSQQQIFNNPAAPFLNNLVTGHGILLVNGVATNVSLQTAYATHYHNVLAVPDGSGPSIHPSEPNYIWSEAGSNLGVLNDNTPYGAGGTNQDNPNHLVTLLTNTGRTWKSYQEDIDLVPNAGGINTPGPASLTSAVASPTLWTVPLTNFSGTSSAYTNAYNGTHQYDYAAKHNPMVFFSDTNGGNNNTNTNPQRLQYAPLQQLFTDLTDNTVADYSWITPNQFNDMHTALAVSFTYNGVTYLNNATQSGAEKIAQGDNFLQTILPAILASKAYKDNGAIILWWDESEPDGAGNTNDFAHTIPEIVISSLAHPNVGGVPYESTVDFTHSSDLRSMQEIFGVANSFLLDAGNAPDLTDLFAPGALAGPFRLTRSGFVRDRRTSHFVQQIAITNTGAIAQAGPFTLILDDLSSNASLANATGITNTAPAGHPLILVPGSSGDLAPGASIPVTLEFADPTSGAITFNPRVVHGSAVP